MIIQMYSCRFQEFYFCFVYVQCSFNNNKKHTKEGHNTPNVLLHVSKEFYFCFIYVKWSLDNNKKHTKEDHNNPEVFLQVSKEQNAW